MICITIIYFYRLAKFSLIEENPLCILCLFDLIRFSTLPDSAAFDNSFLKNEGSCFSNRAASSSLSFIRWDFTFLVLCSSLQLAFSIISCSFLARSDSLLSWVYRLFSLLCGDLDRLLGGDAKRFLLDPVLFVDFYDNVHNGYFL